MKHHENIKHLLRCACSLLHSFPGYWNSRCHSNNAAGNGTHHNYKGGQFVSEKLLSNLTAKGYDVPAISAAVTSGFYPTVMTLMKEFRMAHPKAFPAHAKGSCSGHIGRQLRAQNQQQPNQTSG